MLETSRTNSSPATHSRLLDPTDTFVRRHLGPSDADVASMLTDLGFASLEELMTATIPASIRVKSPLVIDDPTNTGQFSQRGEHETLLALRTIASRNQVFRSYIGMGYSNCIVPGVILRNIF